MMIIKLLPFLALKMEVVVCIFHVNCDLNNTARTTPPVFLDSPGFHLMSGIVNIYQACSSLCRFYMDCSHYTWDENRGMCHLSAYKNHSALLTCQGKAKPCGDRPCKYGEMCIHVKMATSYICLKVSSTPASATGNTTSVVSPTSALIPTSASSETTRPMTTTSSTASASSVPTSASSETTRPMTTTSSTASASSASTTSSAANLGSVITSMTSRHTAPTSSSTDQTTTITPTSSSTSITTITSVTTTVSTTPQARMTLEMACSESSDCIVSRAECYEEKCRCEIGYQFSFRQQECSQSCGNLGTDFIKYSNTGIYDHNEKIFSIDNDKDCEQKCLNEADLTCRTFEMTESSKCRLASVFWFEVSSSARLTGLSNIHLFVRQCV